MRISALDRTAQFSLLSLLVFTLFWRGGKGIEATWILVGVVCVLIILTFLPRESKQERDVPQLLWWSAMIFVCWTVLSFVLSATRNYGLDEVLRDGALTLLLFWTARRARGPDGELAASFRHILLFMVSLTLIACALGMAVYALQPVNRFVGSFFYVFSRADYWPNAWADYLLITWPIVLWWVLRAPDGWRRVLRESLLGIVIGCLLLSYSRGALIAFGGEVILLGIILLRRNGLHRSRGALRTIGIICALSLVLFFALNAARSTSFPVESVARKLTFSADEGASSFTERLQFYRQSLVLSREHPVFGWGPYSFRFIQPRLEADVRATSDHPHDFLLKLAVERGWPAALLSLIVLGSILVPCCSSLVRRRKQIPLDTPFLFVGVVGLLAHSLIDFNLQFVGITLPLTLLLGTLVTPVKQRPGTRWARRAEVFLSILLLLTALYEGVFLVTSSLGHHAEQAYQSEQAQVWYGRSLLSLYPRDLLLGSAVLYQKGGFYMDSQRVIEWYLSWNPEDARGWFIKGENEVKLFRAKNAQQSLQQAYVLGKMNDVAITLSYVQALVAAGQHAKVANMEEQLFSLSTSYAGAIARDAHFIARTGNVEAFVSLCGTLEKLYPGRKEAYRKMATNASEAAKEIRLRAESAQSGMLWN